MKDDKDFKVGRIELFIVKRGISNFPINEAKVSMDVVEEIYLMERKFNKTIHRPLSRWACYVKTSDTIRRIMEETHWYPNCKQLEKAFKHSIFYWIYWLPSKIFNKIYIFLK